MTIGGTIARSPEELPDGTECVCGFSSGAALRDAALFSLTGCIAVVGGLEETRMPSG